MVKNVIFIKNNVKLLRVSSLKGIKIEK